MRPGIVDGLYPERARTSPGLLDQAVHSLTGTVGTFAAARWKYARVPAAIHKHGRLLASLDEAGLAEKTRSLRCQLHRYGLTAELTAQAFALVRETAGRTINMRHFDTQLVGGWIMVHGGLAEMETGEGKTLTATLAAATAALAGIPVHVITVNDYLVDRDARLMEPVYRALGLSVGAVTSGLAAPARRIAYASDIVYCTGKQVAFDYLRDRILLGSDQGRLRLQLERLHGVNDRSDRLFLRGLCFAIIDEADSVLIDEARTPLIISREQKSSDEEQACLQAMELARVLEKTTDFRVDLAQRHVELSDQGRVLLGDAARGKGGIWSGARRREELVCQALAALHLYCRDRHYLVHDGRVLIIDENTGRVMADRSWERGLHQMIEIKENCEVTGQREHLARLTFQRFFRRYLRLAGMTGTAREVRRELWSLYGLRVVKVPVNRPSQRQNQGQRCYGTAQAKWTAVVERIGSMQRQGRPVLVGTRSVADSEHLSRLLGEAGFTHQVLNARQDAREAEIVAKAGEWGGLTVATNMAGRGTDIPLGPGVVGIGGLHIIAVERNEARRIDRQLHGRCGRQGDPGSYESILSLDDELLRQHFGDSARRLLGRLTGESKTLPSLLGLLVVGLAQFARQRRDQRIRCDLLRMDEQFGRLLAFSGRME